jgi:hypothetical protein
MGGYVTKKKQSHSRKKQHKHNAVKPNKQHSSGYQNSEPHDMQNMQQGEHLEHVSQAVQPTESHGYWAPLWGDIEPTNEGSGSGSGSGSGTGGWW